MSWTVDPMHTQVEFSAKHMGLMTVKGHFTSVRAAIDLNDDDFIVSSVEATIDTRSLITNDARRDAHLKSPDFLNVEQFPTITFKSTRIERAAHDQYRMTGDLTIRNVRGRSRWTSCTQGRPRIRWVACMRVSARTRASTARTGA